MNRLEGKHVVVTGARTGIGLAIARAARRGGRAADAARPRRAASRRARRAASVDISDRDAVFAAFTEPLDALVANAGIGGANEPGESDRLDEIVQTNLYGTYWCCRAAEPLLADGGRIVVTSSILARIGVAGYTAYCASKAALLGLVRAFAAELAPRADPGERDLPRLGRTPTWRGSGSRLFEGLTQDEAWEVAKREVPLRRMSEPGRDRGHRRVAALRRRLGVTGQAIDHNNGAFMI